MSLWRWITGRLNVTTDLVKWRAIFGHESDSGESVTPDSAMKLSSWWSCKRLKSSTVATLPCNIYQKDGEERSALQSHPLYPLLHDQPNADQTPVEFWEARVAQVCSHGNSYCEKMTVGNRLVALVPLPVTDVVPVRPDGPRGKLVYRVNDRGKSEDMPPAKIFHVKGFAPGDEDEGLSPVAYAARSIGGALSAERCAARVYGRGLRAAGFWKTPVDFSKEQREQLQKNYIAPAEGPQGEGKSIIMPPGIDWAAMNITPKDAEMLMTRGFNVTDVCRWMGVPPILIGHAQEGQTMWGSGIEQIILGWLVLGLRADIKRIESAVNMRLVSPADRVAGISFEFNFEGLLRADSVARAQLMSTLVQNGLRSRNEMRKIDNFPAYDGGDTFTVQSNLIDVEKLGEAGEQQQQDAETVRTAVAGWLLEQRERLAA